MADKKIKQGALYQWENLPAAAKKTIHLRIDNKDKKLLRPTFSDIIEPPKDSTLSLNTILSEKHSVAVPILGDNVPKEAVANETKNIDSVKKKPSLTSFKMLSPTNKKKAPVHDNSNKSDVPKLPKESKMGEPSGKARDRSVKKAIIKRL
uniref:Uncharacterized protein n=1 Tax=Rhabditophanes sp. KR3021 TaxID=114890 RepID=A0AC35TSU0_9BILA